MVRYAETSIDRSRIPEEKGEKVKKTSFLSPPSPTKISSPLPRRKVLGVGGLVAFRAVNSL